MSVVFFRAGLLLRIACATGLAFLFVGTAQAKVPTEYVKICSVYGSEFFYIPGTDTCIKLGGLLKAPTTEVGSGAVCNKQYFSPDSFCGKRTSLTIDVRQCTEYGVLRVYAARETSCLAPPTATPYVNGLGVNKGYTWLGGEGGFGSSFGTLNTISQQTFGGFDPLSPDRSANISGVNGRIGLTGGADWIIPGGFKSPAFIGSTFVGFEASVDYNTGSFNTITGIPGSQLFTPLGPGTDSISLRKTWDASIGPRAGLSFEGFNLYGTAGISVGSFTAKVECGTGLCGQNFIPMLESSRSTVHVGGYVGMGFNTGQGLNKLGDGNWRWGGEVRYTDYGTVNLTTGNPATYQGSFDVRAQEVTFMLRVMHRSNF